MLVVKAWNLKKGDEFTLDDGVTWHVVKLTRDAALGTRIVVITQVGKEIILRSEQEVTVKL